jgi:predicted MPP superfamily phosphohydrolase
MDKDTTDGTERELSDGPQTQMSYAIGDIHGEASLLRALLAQLPLRVDDMLVFLGDAVNRGPDSLGVVRQILALHQSRPGKVAVLMGNHEETGKRSPLKGTVNGTENKGVR